MIHELRQPLSILLQRLCGQGRWWQGINVDGAGWWRSSLIYEFHFDALVALRSHCESRQVAAHLLRPWAWTHFLTLLQVFLLASGEGRNREGWHWRVNRQCAAPEEVSQQWLAPPTGQMLADPADGLWPQEAPDIEEPGCKKSLTWLLAHRWLIAVESFVIRKEGWKILEIHWARLADG